ncbi:MAG: hypothetical protein M0037_00360 [Betaproteobacteria bacterium]|nr:hypothetical protein [Betaproteobacteria bacterium]
MNNAYNLGIFLTGKGMEKIDKASPGGAGRNRTLGLEKPTAMEVPVPSLEAQQTFDTLQSEVVALVPATLGRVFATATQ